MISLSKNLVCLVVLFSLLLSCNKEEIEMPITPKEDTSVSNVGDVSIPIAKKWFYDEYLKEQSKEATTASNELSREIFWDRAFMDKMSNGQDMVVVPINHYKQGTPPNTNTYLWVYRHENNRLFARVIEYLSSVNDTKGEIDISNFSGAISVKDWNGKLLNGFTYKEGALVGIVESINGQETQVVINERLGKANMIICEIVQITRDVCSSYYYKVCIPHLGTCTEWNPSGTFCTRYSVNVPQCYWAPDFPGQPSPYSGGTPSEITARSASQLTMPGFTLPAINLRKYLDCFGINDAKSKYKLTVYVEEPMAGSGKTAFGTNVGHTFLGLERTTNGVITRQVVGFYPNVMGTGWVSSHVADNGGSKYTVSASWDLTSAGFIDAINGLIYASGQGYHIAQNNCTTTVAYVCDAVGLTFPKNESYFPFFTMQGLSPGQLGKDIRNHQSSSGNVNTTGGNAPSSKGPCN